MNDSRAKIADALLSQAVPAPAPSPYQLNQPLEQATAAQHPAMHPLVAALMNKLGYFGMIRNRANAPLVDPEAPVP